MSPCLCFMGFPSLSFAPQARDDKLDFVEACGKPTLALKKCTDEHPEYYGVPPKGKRARAPYLLC